MSNGLDPDQDPRPVDHDLGPNCLQVISRQKNAYSKERVNSSN